jgi:dTMP kinase
MFITFEGPDGSGKTTQLTLLAEYLGQQGYAVFQTREPGGSSIGDQIRRIVHSHENEEMHPRAEVLLYSASRAQHVEQVIRPRLQAGEIVLCDRFYDSTLAYQGYGHDLDLTALRQITAFATGGLCPDLTFYLEIDPQTGLKRRQKDGSAEWNRLDAQSLAFHQQVYAGYRALIAEEPARWAVVDGDRPVEVIQAEIRRLTLERVERSRSESV